MIDCVLLENLGSDCRGEEEGGRVGMVRWRYFSVCDMKFWCRYLVWRHQNYDKEA